MNDSDRSEFFFLPFFTQVWNRAEAQMEDNVFLDNGESETTWAGDPQPLDDSMTRYQFQTRHGGRLHGVEQWNMSDAKIGTGWWRSPKYPKWDWVEEIWT